MDDSLELEYKVELPQLFELVYDGTNEEGEALAAITESTEQLTDGPVKGDEDVKLE